MPERRSSEIWHLLFLILYLTHRMRGCVSSLPKKRKSKLLLAWERKFLMRLHDSMTAEQRETLEKYDDSVNEMYSLIELEIFFCAFRLGGRLIHADGQWRRRINGKGHTADIVACCVAFLLVPLEECQPKISFLGYPYAELSLPGAF